VSVHRLPPRCWTERSRRTRVRSGMTPAAVALLLVVGGALLPATAGASPTPRAAIVATLDAWPGAWKRHDAAAICGLFARDVVFSFPGGPDRDYATACAQFQRLASDPNTRVSYRRPRIQGVAVSGRLAVVRLIWSVTIRDGGGTILETTREQGLDELRRGTDGRWRVTVSHAYPLE
jgi:uncharacterized protein (TIGR02246 family)